MTDPTYQVIFQRAKPDNVQAISDLLPAQTFSPSGISWHLRKVFFAFFILVGINHQTVSSFAKSETARGEGEDNGRASE